MTRARSPLSARPRSPTRQPDSGGTPKRHKYRAIRTQASDGSWHPSKKQAERHSVLLMLQRGGAISDLRSEVVFKLAFNGVHISDYRADWVYLERQNDQKTWVLIHEDCKGFRTPEYKLKKSLMLAVHGIRIRET